VRRARCNPRGFPSRASGALLKLVPSLLISCGSEQHCTARPRWRCVREKQQNICALPFRRSAPPLACALRDLSGFHRCSKACAQNRKDHPAQQKDHSKVMVGGRIHITSPVASTYLCIPRTNLHHHVRLFSLHTPLLLPLCALIHPCIGPCIALHTHRHPYVPPRCLYAQPHLYRLLV
jgi:hypothetical protein